MLIFYCTANSRFVTKVLDLCYAHCPFVNPTLWLIFFLYFTCLFGLCRGRLDGYVGRMPFFKTYYSVNFLYHFGVTRPTFCGCTFFEYRPTSILRK